MNEMIKAEGLTKDYGHGKGIFDFNFSVRQGETVGIVGTNGSGKTTTMRNMMGFIRPDKGYVSISGYDCCKQTDKVKRLVGYVPGEIDFPDVGSGTAFLKIQADYLGMKNFDYMNKLIDIFKIDVTAPLRRMSKGMKQKTALVEAFMSQPEILLLDEPSTGLDPMMRDALIGIINEQKENGRTIFLSSHVFQELEETCDRVIFIHSGRILDTVKVGEYVEADVKEYRLGFADRKDYDDFRSRKFDIIKSNEKHLHCNIIINDNDINELFGTLSDSNMRYVNYIPYTLEWYYDNKIVPMEN